MQRSCALKNKRGKKSKKSSASKLSYLKIGRRWLIERDKKGKKQRIKSRKPDNKTNSSQNKKSSNSRLHLHHPRRQTGHSRSTQQQQRRYKRVPQYLSRIGVFVLQYRVRAEQQYEPPTNTSGIDIQEFQQTFKGEIQTIRQVIKEQDQTLKKEVKRLVEKTQQTEQDKNRLVEELQKLREEIARQQDEKYEVDWQNLSRTAHWTNSSINQGNQGRKRVVTSEIKLKTTINQGEYFGPMPSGVDASQPLPFLLLKNQQQPLYQSSKLLNAKDFFSANPREEDTEKIRERNIDRLKLLQTYENSQRYSDNLAYLKYSKEDEEDINGSLSKIDKKLYQTKVRNTKLSYQVYLLNPETDRIKQRALPFNLSSPYDAI